MYFVISDGFLHIVYKIFASRLATFIACWNWRTEIENFYQTYKRKLSSYIGQSGCTAFY